MEAGGLHDVRQRQHDLRLVPIPRGSTKNRGGREVADEGTGSQSHGDAFPVAACGVAPAAENPRNKGVSLWSSPKFASSSWKTTTSACKPFARSRSTIASSSAI